MNMDQLRQANAHKRAVFFNGPPGSGKDAAVGIAANFIRGKLAPGLTRPCNPAHYKFAEPLKAAAHALYGIPYTASYYEKEFGHGWKDEPGIEFYGKTPRSEYIALSEDYAKRRHGTDVFGRVAQRRIALEKSANVFLFSDSGFCDEAVPVVSLLGVNHCFVVEVERPDTSFLGDSRGYIAAELNERFAGKIKTLRIPNNGDLSDLQLLVRGAMVKFLGVPYE